MKSRILRNMEWGILICCIALFIISCISLYSATQESGYDELKRQIMWLVISIPIMIAIICVDYNLIARISPIFYGIFLVLLIAVLFTKPINGASSWFSITDSIRLQPSEFAKIFVIITLSYLMSIFQKRDKNEINKPLKLLAIFAVLAIPVLLIIKQPDYGTAIAFMMAAMLMLFAAGIDKRYIIAVVLIIVVALPLAYNFILPDHAKTRIDVFLNPNLDPRGSGYNVIQSKLAIGSRKTIWNGSFKRKPNTTRIFTSKNYRLYFLCNWRRNGICSSWCCYYSLCCFNYKSSICGKNS